MSRLRPAWLAPPQLFTENFRKWWNLIATAGFRGRRLGGLTEMLIFLRRISVWWSWAISIRSRGTRNWVAC